MLVGRLALFLLLICGVAAPSAGADLDRTGRPATASAGGRGAQPQPGRRTTGDSTAIALEQTDCPLTLSPIDLVHDERGSTIRLRVLNEGAAEVTRYSVSAWVVMPDGTVKGSQKFDQKQAVAKDAEKQVSLVIRTIRVAPTDTVILAVVETQGDAWKGDAKALETEARASVKK